MEPLKIEDIIDYKTYSRLRGEFRKKIFVIKEIRRIHVGDNLTFIFENRDTIKYQIQEMLLAEKIDKQESIVHEIETYNTLIGKKGELGCTLLIEIPDKEEREKKLKSFINLMNYIYLEFENDTRIAPIYDKMQANEIKISSVQYLIFKIGDNVPKSIVSEHPDYRVRTVLDTQQKNALMEDLISR